jgi:queuosine precursor transporter
MRQFKYLIILAMVSVSLLNLAMLFTYRLIEIGPFLVPGGVIVFSLTYIFADIVAEVYGYKNAKLLIWGNFICILVFNLMAQILLHLPASSRVVSESAYQMLFSHSFSIIIGYSLGFAVGDFLNAAIVSKLGILARGRFFAFRSIASSAIGQIIFSVVVSSTIYTSQLSNTMLFRQFLSTICAKLIIIMLLAYPSSIVVYMLRKFEGIDVSINSFSFNPFEIKFKS